MISICLPSRGRPKRFAQMMDSAKKTADSEIEFVAYLDDDDPSADTYPEGPTYVRGERIVQSDMWNVAWKAATGDIGMMCGDDVLFRTRGWSSQVERTFNKYPDRIVMVYGDDGSNRKDATLPFLSREWIDASGFAYPPFYKSWFADRWVWEVADMINRRQFLRRLRFEHRHFNLGKAQDDQTYRDGVAFRESGEIRRLYFSEEHLRMRTEQALRLRQVMKGDE